MIIGREKEFAQIESLILNSLKENSAPLSIYISGPPGTGKTATVKAVVKKLLSSKQRNKKCLFVAIDCFASFNAISLSREILLKLDFDNCSSTTTNRPLHILEERFKKTKKLILILLDEVDNLLASKDKIINVAFNWPAKHPGRVIVIGISNTLDLTQRLMPKRNLLISPQLIVFAAYTSTQLVDILKVHLANENVEPKTIELCARKVAAMTGDVRRAFDIASHILANLENNDEEHLLLKDKGNAQKRLLQTPQKTPQKNGCTESPTLKRPCLDGIGDVTPKKNACREVLNVINKTMSSPCQRSKLPLHPRILLATLMRLISTTTISNSAISSVIRTPTRTPNKKSVDCLSVSRDQLFQAYVHVCEALMLNPLESDDLNNAYQVLESQAMIRFSNSKSEGPRVFFMVEFAIARQAINDNSLFNSIEEMDF